MRDSGPYGLPPSTPQSERQILVVDDEHLVADTLTTILRLQGYEATALYSGEDALEWVKTTRPHVILTDVRMRRVSGIETARRVRQLYPACRVILFTASSLSSSESQMIRELGLELLDRPLHPRQLLELLA